MNVKCAEIVVRWRKNRTWGSTCTAEAKVKTENEEWHHYTSPVVIGCGYDKHSQALSYVFNAFFQGHDLATDSGKSSASGGENGAVLHLAW